MYNDKNSTNAVESEIFGIHLSAGVKICYAFKVMLPKSVKSEQ